MKKKKAAGILALSACLIFGASGTALAEWKTADISRAVGYYSAEEISMVLMNNGTMFLIDSETGETRTASFEASSDGDQLLLTYEDHKAVLVRQKEKGKTADGGTYYALYSDYKGNTSEIEFHEGKHVQFGDEIFGNDYEVTVKEPLSVFFGVDGSDAGLGGERTEGSGYDTPEEAVSAYVEGLCSNDVEAMMKACAVESYAENYNLESFVERLNALPGSISLLYLPDTGELSEGINTGHRKGELYDMIKGQYLTLTSAKIMSAGGKTIPITDEYDNASELLQDMFSYDEPEITFHGEILPPVFMISAGRYYSFQNQKNMLRQCSTKGAQNFRDRAAVVYVNGKPGLLFLGTLQYDDKWFVTDNSMISVLFGLTSFSGGAVMFDSEDAEEYLDFSYEACLVYQSNTLLQETVNKLTDALEAIDMEKILSLPEDEQSDAYDEEIEKLENMFNDQEIAMIEQSLVN